VIKVQILSGELFHKERTNMIVKRKAKKLLRQRKAKKRKKEVDAFVEAQSKVFAETFVEYWYSKNVRNERFSTSGLGSLKRFPQP
jgi:hypothetical protein